MKLYIFLFFIIFSGRGANANSNVLFPLVYSTPETSLALGLINIYTFDVNPNGKNSYVRTFATYTVKDQFVITLSPTFFFDEGKTALAMTLGFQDFPNQYFGQQEKELDVPESYAETMRVYGFEITRNIFSSINFVFAGSYREYDVTNFEIGGVLEEKNSEFLNFKNFVIDYKLQSDRRDHPLFPTKGHLISVSRSFQRVDLKKSDNTIEFSQDSFDARAYFKTDANKVLAVQAHLTKIDEDKVPFQLLPSLGGNFVLKGYFSGRYRNTHAAFIQTELRGGVNDKWGWSTFLGLGKTGESMGNLNDNKLRNSFGAGIRYLIDPSNKLFLKFDIGASPDGVAPYLLIGESF